jgi:hypothetical protein
MQPSEAPPTAAPAGRQQSGGERLTWLTYSSWRVYKVDALVKFSSLCRISTYQAAASSCLDEEREAK